MSEIHSEVLSHAARFFYVADQSTNGERKPMIHMRRRHITWQRSSRDTRQSPVGKWLNCIAGGADSKSWQRRDALVEKAGVLPFRVKLPGQPYFFEGDVSEADTLIEADDAFVQRCGDVIGEVSAAVRRPHPDFV